jgi:aspartate racemase
MKKIGIIGGLAWPSTADYYRLLCKKTNDHFQRKDYKSPFPTPPIILESLNTNEARAARGRDGDESSWAQFDSIFRDTFVRLANAGADFGLIASNTPHTRLKYIKEGLDLPIISILETTASKVAALGGESALILGTPITMRSRSYPEELRAHGIETISPLSDKEVEELEHLIDIDLYQGKLESAREQLLNLCETHIGDPSKDVICLACTELPLAFPEHSDAASFEINGFHFVNTTVTHVDAALIEVLPL